MAGWRASWGAWGVASAAWAVVGCQVPDTGPHSSLEPLWRDYQELPRSRALALAGDPTGTVWVAAAAGGAASPEEAKEAALASCRQKRLSSRLRVPCLIYAVDDEIVWTIR